MTIQDEIKRLSAQCVKCAVCAPSCPSYQVSLNEGESPRGRIALMEALASGALSSQNNALIPYLDSCLYCQSCERVCPADVQYSKILNLSHRLLAKTRPMPRLLAWIFSRRYARKVLAILLFIYQKMGLHTFFLHHALLPKGLARLNKSLPKLHIDFPLEQKTNPGLKKVQIFLSCTSQYIDTETLAHLTRLLNAIGYSPSYPSKGNCCGAFHLHYGNPQFQTLQNKVITSFDAHSPILFIDSGCGMILKQYENSAFVDRCQNIFSFLAKHRKQFQFKPYKKNLLVHLPCSQKNALKDGAALFELLDEIPDLNYEMLASQTTCCGAAGLAMFTHPKMAKTLAENLLSSIKPRKTRQTVISNNLGCRLHLNTQSQRSQRPIHFIHPLVFLAKQLDDAC